MVETIANNDNCYNSLDDDFMIMSIIYYKKRKEKINKKRIPIIIGVLFLFRINIFYLFTLANFSDPISVANI